jgi:hypothetical protein
MTNHINCNPKGSDTSCHNRVFHPSLVSDVKLVQRKKDVKLNAVSEENSRCVRVIPTHLANLKDIVVHTHDDLEDEHDLDPNYQVQIKDVIWDSTGRKGSHMKHPGNRRLMVIIEMNTIKYRHAKTKAMKSNIIRHVVDVIRQSGGRFIQRSCSSMNGSGAYCDIGSIRARDRVRGLFREDDRRSTSALRKAKHVVQVKQGTKYIQQKEDNIPSSVVEVTDVNPHPHNVTQKLIGSRSRCTKNTIVVGEVNHCNGTRCFPKSMKQRIFHRQLSRETLSHVVVDPYRMALQNYQHEYDLLQTEYHKLQQLLLE